MSLYWAILKRSVSELAMLRQRPRSRRVSKLPDRRLVKLKPGITSVCYYFLVALGQAPSEIG
jgi:hypothetical protein